MPTPTLHPLSAQQLECWVAWLQDKNNPKHNTHIFYKITEEFNDKQFIKAFHHAFKGCATFHTHFCVQEGKPYTFSKASKQPLITSVDLSELRIHPNEEKTYIIDRISQPIDLLTYPNFRTYLYHSQQEGVYYFVAVFPHSLMDAHACQLLLKRLAQFYNGNPATMPLTHQSEFITHASDASSAAYWKKQLSQNALTVDFNTRIKKTYTPCHRRIVKPIQGAPVLALTTFAKQHHTTVFLTLLSLFAALIYRYTNQSSFSILYPVDLRKRGYKHTLGCQSNMIPLCVTLTEPSILLENFIAKITQQRKADRSHQQHLFSNLCTLARQIKGTSCKLFNLAFSKTLLLPHDFELQQASIEAITTPISALSYDLSVYFDKQDDQLLLALDYDANKFTHHFAQQILSHLEYLITKLATVAKQPLSSFAYLQNSEIQQLQQFSNCQQQKPLQQNPVLFSQFQTNVKQQPNAIAIHDTQGELSYQALEHRVYKLINFLKNNHTSTTEPIAILLDRNRDYIASILALMALACPYVPLEPNTPPSRIALILEDANCQYVITNNKLVDQITPSTTCLLLDALPEKSQVQPVSLPQIDASSLAYIIYTSGTTGKPKGVPIKQSALVELFSNTLPLFDFSEKDTWSLSHSLAFDFSVWEIWGCLLSGGQLVMASQQTKQHPEHFYQWVSEKKISVFSQTPSAFKQFSTIDARRQQTLYLRHVIFGGEKLDVTELASWVTRHLLSKVSLANLYGLTEAPIHATHHKITSDDIAQGLSPIGRPLAHLELYLLDERGNFIPSGCLGEICLSGDSVTEGYLNAPTINQERFVVNIIHPENTQNMYRTGDYAWWTQAGVLVYSHRKDQQINYRGHRVELDEIHYHLQKISYIENAVSLLYSSDNKQPCLITFCIVNHPQQYVDKSAVLLNYLKSHLPYYMIPSDIVFIDHLPLTAQGKIDTVSLQHTLKKSTLTERQSTDTDLLKSVINSWEQVLDRKITDRQKNFFDLGGSSIDLSTLHYRLEQSLGESFAFNTLLEHTTIASQVAYLDTLKNNNRPKHSANHVCQSTKDRHPQEVIAIVGMALRLPGATSPHEFWQNLVMGEESITQFSATTLLDSGIPNSVIESPNYVAAKGYLPNANRFDASFFGYNDKEAAIIDPQQRLFLTTCWLALQDAGQVAGDALINHLDPQQKIGVFGSQSQIHPYLVTNLLNNTQVQETFSPYQLYINNAPDFLCARVAYKLGLSGPSLTIQSGCSSSLIAVCQAMQSLRNGQCDVALAGGVALSMPLASGYHYQPGMILSPDGHCRAFDTAANGTVPSNGVVVMTLKRLQDAIADKNSIYAIIKGYAVNNDAAKKLGFTAPSQSGQVDVIQSAIQDAGIDPRSLDYIETHGTATPLGDAIEIAALDHALPNKKDNRPYRIGSVKTNLGHLDVAAGITGLAKAALCLYHKQWVPSLHFQTFSSSIQQQPNKFQVVNSVIDLNAEPAPLRAGVSSFAIGGSNAHVILESYQSTEQQHKPSPTSCLKETVHWVYPDQTRGNSKKPIYIYQPSWRQQSLATSKPSPNTSENTVFFIMTDKHGISYQLQEQLNQANKTVYLINTSDPSLHQSSYLNSNAQKQIDYSQLFSVSKHISHIEIIHMQSLHNKFNNQPQTSIGKQLNKTAFNEVMQLLKHCAHAACEARTITITCVTNGLFQVWGNETLYPEKHLILGPLLTLPRENKHTHCRIIDIVFSRDKKGRNDNNDRIIDQLIKEIGQESTDRVIAYRNKQRFIRSYLEVNAPDTAEPTIKSKGVYVITGGTGHIGLALAKAIAAQHSVHLVLLQRRTFPDRTSWNTQSWDKETKTKINQLKRIESLGSTIWLLCCDVSNMKKTQCAIEAIMQKYQRIDGVIHAAGVASGGLIADYKHSFMDKTLLAKVQGTINLHHALKKVKPTFLLLCSALSALRGDYGQAIYNAGATFLDAFAHWRKQHDGLTLSVNWDAWQAGGMAKRFFESIGQASQLNNALADEPASQTVLSLLNTIYSQYVISTKKNPWQKAIAPYFVSTEKKSPANISNQTNLSDIEEKLLSIWREYLGESLSRTDNYFDSGGDSLLAIQLIEKVTQTWQLTLEPNSLMQTPTVATLAKRILALKNQQTTSTTTVISLLKKARIKPATEWFFIHPIGGTSYIYKALTDALGPHITCYSIQNDTNKHHSKHYSVAELASNYLGKIRQVSPHGPYYLGGFSFGGTVAYEIAQQCHDQKLSVAHLILIDTPSQNNLPQLAMNNTHILRYLLEVGEKHRVDPSFYTMKLNKQLDYFMKHSGQLTRELSHSDYASLKKYLSVFKANMSAMQHYHPTVYQHKTPVNYFRAKESDAINPRHPEKGWKNLIDPHYFSVHEIPGNHLTLMHQHNVLEIAHIINEKTAIHQKIAA